MSVDDAEDLSLLALFRDEVESHAIVLTEGLVGLEAAPGDAAAIEPLMRAAHSIKGAARVVGLDAAVRIAHAMEDAFVGAQEGRLVLPPAAIDLLLRAVDWIAALSRETEEALPNWLVTHAEEGEELERRLAAIGELRTASAAAAVPPISPAFHERSRDGAAGASVVIVEETSPSPAHAPTESAPVHADADARAVKVTADALTRLIGLAAESLVEARRLEPLGALLQQLKARQLDAVDLLERLRQNLAADAPRERTSRLVTDTQHVLDDCNQTLNARIADFDALSWRSANLSGRLYDHIVSSRMRPFGDATQGLARLVRDLARRLGKRVRLEIAGRGTEVDREILEELEAPLNHLLRNAVDHGIEMPEERLAAGKREEGRIGIEAVHAGGMLMVRVTDDGRGIDPDAVRRRIVERGLASQDLAARLGETELFEFVLLPGFSTRDAVSETSGRGVGLDAVQTMVQTAGGSLRIASGVTRGTQFELRLPVTRSVLRALIVTVAGEPYAFPLARTARVLAVDASAVRMVEGRPYIDVDGESVALVPAREVLELEGPDGRGDGITAVVVAQRDQRFALEVDSLGNECDLVVRPLDARLGKVPDIAAASTLPDGSPVLILDVDDLVRSIDALVTGGRLTRARRAAKGATEVKVKRVLVVDDSLTVREIERRLLENEGYQVEVAVDGVEGWNALRLADYDLILTDVDMPRMNGIELVRRIKADPRLRALPVVIVSYKDREEDRLRGLEAGADHYLTKSSFQDEAMVRLVRDLIGRPTE